LIAYLFFCNSSNKKQQRYTRMTQTDQAWIQGENIYEDNMYEGDPAAPTHTKMRCFDGSNYTGGIDRFGMRKGHGVWRSNIYIYGVVGEIETTSAEALLHWMEYSGEWWNDKPRGFGILTQCRGDGSRQKIFQGDWMNGEQIGPV